MVKWSWTSRSPAYDLAIRTALSRSSELTTDPDSFTVSADRVTWMSLLSRPGSLLSFSSIAPFASLELKASFCVPVFCAAVRRVDASAALASAPYFLTVARNLCEPSGAFTCPLRI